MSKVKRKAAGVGAPTASAVKRRKDNAIVAQPKMSVNSNIGYKNCTDESQAQEMLIAWTEYMKARFPDLSMIYHVPNEGKRSVAMAAKMKRMGLKSGVPDLCLPVPVGKWHGMYIEMKANRNKPTEGQKKWLTRLGERGYYCVVAWSFEYARDEILRYLKGELK